jgi:hypothetical protein
MMIWIYSFGSDTTQGGYETCVKRVSPRQLKALRPDIEQVDFCSDAGSGYKSTQTILDLRNAKKTTGIRVKAAFQCFLGRKALRDRRTQHGYQIAP